MMIDTISDESKPKSTLANGQADPMQPHAAVIESIRAEAPGVLSLPLEEATLRCEQLVRSYDPCISCATHFLKLEIVEE